MKQRIITLMLALVGLTANVKTFAESIPIDEAHFPDPVFRNYILNEMKYHRSDGKWALVGEDGKLSDYERKRVVNIAFNDGCQSAEGIQYFAKSETGTWGQKIMVNSDNLKTLDLSGMDVTEVNAEGNNLETLNLSGCAKLTKVECQLNKLTTLNLSGCTSLVTLYCFENQLTSLNLTGLMKLRFLKCQENSITGLNIVSPYIEVIDCSDNPMTYLFLPTISYANLSTYTDLRCSNTQIHTLDLGDNKYSYVNCSDSPVNGIVWSSAGNGCVHQLWCNNTNIIAEDILAIPNPEEVSYLSCEGCGLTSIDLSKLTGLNWLRCGDNLLTTLDVSLNLLLRTCAVDNNKLFALDVSGTPCSSLGNSSQNLEGQALEMDGKTYVRLNNEVNVDSISDLYVWHQSQFVSTTISTPTMRGEYLLVDETGASDVSKVRYRYHVGNGVWMWVEINTGAYGVAINEYNFPDQKFRNFLLGEDYGADALLTQEEIDGITELDMQEKNITSLEGIQYLRNLAYLNVYKNNLTDAGFSDVVNSLTNLTELWFSYNSNITRFDAGQNIKLRYLHGADCALTTLDVRGCTELLELDCEGNQLTFLNVSENTKLRELQCRDNQLTQIYGLDDLTDLRNLDCTNNQLTALDVSNFSSLSTLACGGNGLTTLNLTHNSNLRYLYVEMNQLSALDLTQNQLLKQFSMYGNQLKFDAMCSIVETLPPLATTYNMRSCYEGLSSEGNELTPNLVNALKAKGWNPRYTTDGLHWQDYEGGTVAFDLWLRGTQVTSASAGDLSSLAGVSGTGSFDELTNTLTLNDVTITGGTIVDAIGLKSQIEGLTINLIGNNTINVMGREAILLNKKTTITGTGRLTAKSDICCIRLNSDTLFVTGGATLNAQSTGTEGYGIFGLATQSIIPRVGEVTTYHASLVIEGGETKVLAIGPTLSVANLNALVMPSGTKFTVTDESDTRPHQVDGYFFAHNVCTRLGSTYTPTTNLVAIITPAEGIAIDATNFPDAAFRNYLLAQPYGSDAVLTDDELEDISTLTLTNLGIADLTGVTYFYALEKLYAIGNALKSVNLEGLTMLENVDVMDNQISQANMIGLINSLPEGDGFSAVLIYHRGSAIEENFEPDEALIEAAYQKGWKLTYQAEDDSFNLYEAGIDINTTNFPDPAFRYHVSTNLDMDRDGFLFFSELRRVTALDITNRGIENLTGIEHFTELESLYCPCNNLTKLDVSNNTKLETLVCDNNKLTEIKTNDCNMLKQLYCNNNQLTDMALKNMFIHLPIREEPGELHLEYKGSETEGNIVNLQRIASLKKTRNWTCYYTTDGVNWLEYEIYATGDVNMDGVVNVSDVTMLVSMILGNTPHNAAADVNGDTNVNVSDVTALVSIILGN